jgi:trigger factor
MLSVDISIQKNSPTSSSITIKLAHSHYHPVWEKECAEFAKKVDLKGFRKGKVPLAIVKERYGSEIMKQVIEKQAKEAFSEGLKANKITPLGLSAAELPEGLPIPSAAPQDATIIYEVGTSGPFTPAISSDIVVESYSMLPFTSKDVDYRVKEAQRHYADREKAKVVEEGDRVLFWVCPKQNVDKEGEDIRGFLSYVDIDTTKNPALKSFLGKVRYEDFSLTKEALLQLVADGTLRKDIGDMAHEEKELAYKLSGIDRFHEVPPLTQPFFDKVLESGSIMDLDTFRTRLTERTLDTMRLQLREWEHQKIRDVIIEATAIGLPEEQLKSWLAQMYEISSEELDERSYLSYQKRVKWSLIEDKLVKAHNLAPTEEDIHKVLRLMMRERQRKAGEELTDEQVDDLLGALLKDEGGFYKVGKERAGEDKLMAYIKSNITLNYTSLSYEHLSQALY